MLSMKSTKRRAASLAALLTLCLAPHGQSMAQDLLTPSNSTFTRDRQRGVQAYVRSPLSQTTASEALNLVLGHELGHEFWRQHGPMPGVPAEEFADRFAVNLLMSMRQFRPEGVASMSEQVAATQTFFGHAPAQTHAQTATSVARRQRELECALVGQAGTFSGNGVYAEAADSGGWGSDVATWLSRQSAVGYTPQSVWKATASRERAASARLVARYTARWSANEVTSCRNKHAALRSYVRKSLARPGRFESVRGNYSRFASYSALNARMGQTQFEYARPETEGGWLLLGLIAPSQDQSASGVAYLLTYAQLEAWLSGDPNKTVVRLNYCGIGLANAKIFTQGGRTYIHICYEIGEEMLANYRRYAKLDPVVQDAARRNAYAVDPKTAKATEDYVNSVR